MLDIQPVGIDDGLDLEDKRSGIALIDADTIAYTSCLECEIQEELLPWSFYTEEEQQEWIDHPNFDAETHSVWTVDLEELYRVARTRVDKIIYETDSVSAELYFSSGKNFRHEVHDMYKGNRLKTRYPAGLEWLKAELADNYDGEICKGYEADDAVVYLKRKFPKKYKLCAIDKDVLHAVPGHHFDYYHARMYWIDTDLETATKWPYMQCLMGDTADNIAGLKGIGKVRAGKALTDCILPCECWNAVVNLYIEKGETIKHAITTMRLVGMHQLIDGGKIKLWQPPCITDYERSQND